MAVETEGRVLTGTIKATTTGLGITVGKETGIGECIGMFKVECKMASLAEDTQLLVDLTEYLAGRVLAAEL
jgi:hypothetical protein